MNISSRGQGQAGAVHWGQGGVAHCASVRRERVSCRDRRPMKLGRPDVEQVLSSLQSLLKEVRRDERDSVLRQGRQPCQPVCRAAVWCWPLGAGRSASRASLARMGPVRGALDPGREAVCRLASGRALVGPAAPQADGQQHVQAQRLPAGQGIQPHSRGPPGG